MPGEAVETASPRPREVGAVCSHTCSVQRGLGKTVAEGWRAGDGSYKDWSPVKGFRLHPEWGATGAAGGRGRRGKVSIHYVDRRRTRRSIPVTVQETGDERLN